MDFTGKPTTTTAHHITEEWSLSSHILQARVMHESHTGSNVPELLHNVETEWDITEKDPTLVSDNMANMVVGTQSVGFLHVKWYAHTLNLASERSLQLPAVARVLGRVQHVTGFFHSVLEQKQKLLELTVCTFSIPFFYPPSFIWSPGFWKDSVSVNSNVGVYFKIYCCWINL